MIEPRIYRAAFVPALLAVVLVMFSLESRPRPLPQGLAADVLFDGRQAVATTRAIVDAAPDRRAGTVGDREAAPARGRGPASARGFAVEVDRFESDGQDLVNVIGRRAGRTRRQKVVVVAARDASGVPDAGGSAADTAALMELARVFEGRPSQQDAGARVGGRVGPRRGGRAPAGRAPGRPGPGRRRAGGLRAGRADRRDRRRSWPGRTTPRACRDRPPAHGGGGGAGGARRGSRRTPGSPGQLARLAFPMGIGAQGVLLDRGYDAVRIAGGGELRTRPRAPRIEVDPRPPRRPRPRGAAHGRRPRPERRARARPAHLRDGGRAR